MYDVFFDGGSAWSGPHDSLFHAFEALGRSAGRIVRSGLVVWAQDANGNVLPR